LFSVLKRVRFEWPAPEVTWSWAEVAAEMRQVDRVLTILNTKADALALLDALPDPAVFHLSTLLCGAHRRDVLAVVRARLQRKEPCRLVSTQVVEAGVDLGFPVVLRALGPLDRIVQAAGRCNREGRLAELGRVVVFRPEEGGMPPGPYKTATGVTEVLLAAGQVDPDDPATFARYFSRVFTASELDAKGVQAARARLSFETVATDFQMIENDTVSVFVIYKGLPDALVGDRSILPDIDHAENSRQLLASLRRAAAGSGRPGAARELLQRAQPYVVSVRKRELEKVAPEGLASELFEGLWAWEGGYDLIRGLVLSKNPEELVC
jgi:CRISPR-associated endonuclease/helicase Cas3